jgi:fumarylacetoacetase
VTAGGTSWVQVPEGSHFPVQNLPYGVFARPGQAPRVGVAIGGQVLDLAGLTAAGLLPGPGWFAAPSLNPFMAEGPAAWRQARARLTDLLSDPHHRDQVEPHLEQQAAVELRLPFDVADYVDFYSSRDHATTVGQIFRPGSPPLHRNWLHLPVGYHGRAGSVVVSGTPVIRPHGQLLPAGPAGPATGGAEPVFGPTRRLDFEAEVGFVVGVGSALGQPVTAGEFRQHAFGFMLVNDWSARDI